MVLVAQMLASQMGWTGKLQLVYNSPSRSFIAFYSRTSSASQFMKIIQLFNGSLFFIMSASRRPVCYWFLLCLYQTLTPLPKCAPRCFVMSALR